MSIWGRMVSWLSPPPARASGSGGSSPPPWDDSWYPEAEQVRYGQGAGFAPGTGGVTADSAMRVAAVFACVRILANTVAQLPLRLTYRGRPTEVAAGEPLDEVLSLRPNGWQTPFEFRQMMQGHLALRGNAYGRVRPGPRGAVDSVVPMHPDAVTPLRVSDDRIAYDVRRADGRTERLTMEEVFHLRGFSTDGIVGVGPIQFAAQVIGGSIAAQTYGTSLLTNGGRPAGALKLAPGKKANDLVLGNLRKTWYAQHGGPANAGRVAILEEGMEWVDVGMTNEDMQWIEYMKLGRADIAMIFGVPPHMIGDVERSTSWGTGIEEQGIGFVSYTLGPWLGIWEQAVDRDLVTDPATFAAKFDVDGLTRGNAEKRVAAYAAGINCGLWTVNECRAKEGLQPMDGGDVLRVPLNTAPATDPAGDPADTSGSNPDE